MRSVKLFLAAALITSFVAGPVLANENVSGLVDAAAAETQDSAIEAATEVAQPVAKTGEHKKAEVKKHHNRVKHSIVQKKHHAKKAVKKAVEESVEVNQ